MNAQRQVDLHGSISACNAAGRTLQVVCAGSQLRIDADSVRAALSAFSALRASGAVDALDPKALERLNDFGIELWSGANGSGALAQEHAPVGWRAPSRRCRSNLNLLALLKAALTAF